MATSATFRPGEISLNALIYKIKGEVESELASVYPPAFRTGEVTSGDHPNRSIVRWSDWSDGIGVENTDAEHFEADKHFSWFSTCNPRYPGHLVLGPLVTTINGRVGGLIQNITSYRNNVYVRDACEVHQKTSDSGFGANLYCIAIVGVCGLQSMVMPITLNGTRALVWAGGSALAFTCVCGTSITTICNGGATLAKFDSRMWSLARTTVDGQMFSYTTLAASAGVAENLNFDPPPAHDIATAGILLTGKDARGNDALYMLHTSGLYQFDSDNSRWQSTGLDLTPAISVNLSLAWFLGAVYAAHKNEIFEYRPGSPPTIRIVGLNPRDGLPELYRSFIQDIAHTPYELVVLTNQGDTTGTADARAAVFAWDRKGWRVLWTGATGTGSQEAIYVTAAGNSVTRVYWSSGSSPGTLNWIDVHDGPFHPQQITEQSYAGSSTHETPRFNVGDDVVGNLLSLKVRHTGCTSTIHITCFYRSNDATAWTQLTDAQAGTTNFDATDDRIEGSDGITEFIFPDRTDPTGLAFRNIQFRFDLVTGTATSTPDIRSVTFEYEKTLPLKWAHRVTIAVRDNLSELSAEQLLDNIRTAIDADTLVEFTFRSRDDDVYNYWVRILSVKGLEKTGNNFEQEIQLLLVEP